MDVTAFAEQGEAGENTEAEVTEEKDGRNKTGNVAFKEDDRSTLTCLQEIHLQPMGLEFKLPGVYCYDKHVFIIEVTEAVTKDDATV